jgi:hypothetical protein
MSEANDRIQVRHSLQNFGMVEARVAAAHGDVGRYPALVQGTPPNGARLRIIGMADRRRLGRPRQPELEKNEFDHVMHAPAAIGEPIT